jgi:hypothetical protein
VPRTASVGELSIDHAVLRTAIGRNVRYEQLIATVQGDELLDVGLSRQLDEITVEAFVDQQLSSVRREGNRLLIALPVDNKPHAVDLRVWIPEVRSEWFPVTEPKLQLPRTVGRVFWQIVSPLDSHVVWAAPTLGRAMQWELDQWRLARIPLRSDQMLAVWAGVEATRPMPPGNRYLYVGTDPSSFRAVTATRGQLWGIVAAIVLAFSAVLIYVPSTRHPFSAVLVTLALAGLIAISPDSAVLAGQFAMIALALVVVMTSIRALMTPRRGDRVFRTAHSATTTEPSTRTIKPRVPARDRRVVRELAAPVTTALPAVSADEPTATQLDAALEDSQRSSRSQGSSKSPPPSEVPS